MSELATKVKTGPFATVVINKYRDGETPTAIAKWLQEDMLEFTEVHEARLASEIKKYVNESLSIQERLELVKHRGAIRETIATKRERVAVLDELEKLYALQLGRIEIDHATEKRINKLFGGLNNEIELARRMIGDIARIRQELGVDERAPQNVNVNVTGGQDINLKLGLLAKKLMDSVDVGVAEVVDEEVTDVEATDSKPYKAIEPPQGSSEAVG